jgi:hypothetical protein
LRFSAIKVHNGTDNMSRVRQTARGYLFWTYERGSLHYDVMVTAILAFVFISPRYINYKDKPIERSPHQTGVIVNPDGQGGLYFQVEASAVSTQAGTDVDTALLRVIEPIAGEVKLVSYKPVTDRAGHVTAYMVRVERQ